ncbi:MAG TPA: hypothetical protein VKM54_00870 [Myxococcota bacterium]|nr:hypothetical protein [Myxococcota bacterium]
MKRIEGSYSCREGVQGTPESYRREFYHRDAGEELTGRFTMRLREVPGVDPIPNLVLGEPARD